MKKILMIGALLYAGLTGCNNAALDGDAATDTTNTTGGVPVSKGPYGDTARDVSNDGTKTNMDMITSNDSLTNSNQPADSTGGINNGGKDRTPAVEGQN